MKRRYLVAGLLVVVALFAVGCGSSPKEDLSGWVHIMAVPTNTPSGLSTEPMLKDFETSLCKLAGRFSRIGSAVGGSMSEGAVKRELNYYYIVYADRDLSQELTKEIATLFQQQTPFVVATPAKWYAKAPAN